MEQSIDAPQQYKQPSRKGKRSWRKNVDVSEIQAGLEEARVERITGGIINEKPSESLFILDTAGSTAIQSSYRRTHKPLKSDQILAQRSVVPAVSNHNKSDRVTNGVIEPSSKRRKSNGVSPREYERLKGVAYGPQRVQDVIRTDEIPFHDPWAADAASDVQDPNYSYLEKKKAVRAPRTLKEAPISLVAGTKQVSAVAQPKPGTSYNPAFQDWDALLASEGAKAVEAEKKRLREVAREEEHLARIAAAEQEAERDEAMQTEDESAWEGFESDYDGAEWMGKKRPERKTPTERKKIDRRKERERREKWEKKARAKDQREKEIARLKKQVDHEAKQRAQALADKASTELGHGEVDERVLRRRRLGKDAIPPPPMELVLPDELQESLRRLKPEGNLLKDRFRNIFISGKMEMRKPIQQAKKTSRTYTEKWSYKDWQLAA